jgi:hypothetical protein
MPSINAKHVSAETAYSEERITCICGEVITARPDSLRDRHQPLIDAWNDHRLGRTAEARAAGQDRRRNPLTSALDTATVRVRLGKGPEQEAP